jgi:hypothetical protein
MRKTAPIDFVAIETSTTRQRFLSATKSHHQHHRQTKIWTHRPQIGEVGHFRGEEGVGVFAYGVDDH